MIKCTHYSLESSECVTNSERTKKKIEQWIDENWNKCSETKLRRQLNAERVQKYRSSAVSGMKEHTIQYVLYVVSLIDHLSLVAKSLKKWHETDPSGLFSIWSMTAALFFFFCNRNRTWNASDFGVVMLKMILTRHNGTRYSLFGFCCFFSLSWHFLRRRFFSCLILAIIQPRINKCLFRKMIIDRESPFFASFDGASFFVPLFEFNGTLFLYRQSWIAFGPQKSDYPRQNWIYFFSADKK